MKFKDIAIGDRFIINAAVIGSRIAFTKSNKAYLDFEVFDGTEALVAKFWDWPHKNVPERNTVLELQGTMGEYLGTRQLTVTLVARNTDMDIADFAPQCLKDVNEYLQIARDLINLIRPAALRQLTLKVWLDHADLLSKVPGAKKIHHAWAAGTLVHSVEVATKALAISCLTESSHDGLCIAGGLLHDIGKLFTYTMDGICIDYTDQGETLDHIALGLLCLNDYKTTENAQIVGLLQHIIASHHGKLEYGSPVTPVFIEAWIVSYADGIDAKISTIEDLNRKAKLGAIWTEKDWTLENKRMKTIATIQQILKEEE